MSDQINYSIGILIILLMFFWFVSKSIGINTYQQLHQQCDGHHTSNQLYKENFSPTLSYNGETIIDLSESPLPYIRYNNETNTIKVPNSKSAYVHLFDKEMIPCGVDTDRDNEPSSMHLQKRKTESMCGNEIPKSLTSLRGNQNIDRNDRLSMSSF